INPFVIDDVHIQKGVYSPSYENRIGGILDIRLSEDPASSLHGAIGSTMTEAHGELSIPIITKKLRLQLSGRHSIANLIHDNPTLESYGRKLFRSTELFDEKEEDENLDESDTGINYSDITAKLMYRPNDQFYFSSSFLRTENNFEHAFNFGIEEPAGRDNLYTYSLIWTNLLSYKWNDRSITSLRANLSKYNSLYDFNFNESSGSTSSILRSNANDISDLQIKWTHQFLWKDFDFEGGYTFDFKDLSYSISEESRFEEDLTGGDDQVGNFHHLYLNSRWHHGDWLFEIGGRGTFWDEDQSFIFSPRFNISRSLTPDLNIKFSGGLFNQYIRQLEQFNESSLNLENQLWVLATEDLMTAQKLGIGLIYQKKGWLIDIDTYYQFADRVPVLTSGQSSELEINSMGNLNSIGLELLIKRRWQQWHSALSYHLSEVTFNIPEFIDEQFPGNNDQRHNLTWINYFKYKSWSIGAQYQFRSGLPFTEIDELTYVEEDEEDYYEVKVDGLNDQRLGHYHRLDLYIGFQKLLANQMQFDAQLSLLNILNFQNTTSRSYVLSESATGSDPEIFEVEKLQLGRTPQVLFRLSF
ncbi:MAG: hypothetical protein KJP00_00665, partial [Bacteroidia bacterium]|nr:hypothetical protein [Bacteroidia bacterium]